MFLPFVFSVQQYTVSQSCEPWIHCVLSIQAASGKGVGVDVEIPILSAAEELFDNRQIPFLLEVPPVQ